MEKVREELVETISHMIGYEDWGDKTAEDVAQDILSLLALREALEKAEKTKKALVAVLDLINNSYGVAGLHFNGNVAPWDSLLEGGEFEEWLKDFSKAIEVKDGQG